jgi:hypothetical protein
MGHRIRLRDLRYYILTGLILGVFNGLCAFGPDFVRSLGSDGLVALTSTGPIVPYWIEALSVLAVGLPIFALMGALMALPVGYYQLQKLYKSGDRTYPERDPGPSPRARFPPTPVNQLDGSMSDQ